MQINFSTDDITDVTQEQSNPVMIDVNLEGEAGQATPGSTPPNSKPEEQQPGERKAEPKTPEDKGMIEIDEQGEGQDPQGHNEAPENKGTPEQQPSNDSTPSPYTLFGEQLFENGVLTVFDKEKVKTLDDLQDAVAETIYEQIEEYKNSLPEPVRKIVEHAERTGEVNLKAAIETQQKVLDVIKITDDALRSDKSLQEKILYEDLKARNYTEARIKRYIDNVMANETLEEEAVDALAARKEAAVAEAKALEESNKAMQEKLETERKNTLEAIRKDIAGTTEVVPGIKLSKKEQDTLFASMTTVVGEDQNGNPVNAVYATRSKNVLAFEKMVHFLHSKGVFNLDKEGNPTPDWSYFVKGIKTNVAKNTAQVIESGFKPGNPGNPGEDNGLMSALNQMFGK